MKLPRIRIGRPQGVALLLLLFLFGECLWLISRQHMTISDYDIARCGRETWEKPNPLAGYYTSCGNLQDGTLAYRAAGLPLTLQRLWLAAADHFRAPENRTGIGAASEASEWELRHELSHVLLLEHLPFALFAIWLGGGLWWVCRRLFGNAGGALALGFYCLNPLVLAAAVVPNNDVLAMWGMYGSVYTAIGVAHAMHGPRRKWKPRIALLALALGLTAAAHVLAAILALAISLVLMLYLAGRSRAAVLQVLGIAAAGAAVVLFASYSFSPSAFGYLFRGGEARFWFSLEPLRHAWDTLFTAPTLIALATALALYAAIRRSRYFGNSAPLLLAAVLLPLLPTGSDAHPWLWAVPFALTFLGGVWADALETKYRRTFLVLSLVLLAAQALVTGIWLANA